MCGDVERVDAVSGIAPWQPVPRTVTRKSVHPAMNVPRPQRTKPRGRAGVNMERERRLGSWLRGQDARREHGLRPRKTLLVGLKDEPDGAAQLRLMLPQQLRRAKEHGRVQIVAAACMAPFSARKGRSVRSVMRQGVHVGAQEHAAAVSRP